MNNWQIDFNNNYMVDNSKSHPGREVTVSKTFCWNGNECQIPAVYLFAEGIAVDFCMKVDNEKVQAFLDKWYLNQRDDMTHFSREDQMQIEQKHPLSIQSDFEISDSDYASYLAKHNIELELEKVLKPFQDKKVNLPLHERI